MAGSTVEVAAGNWVFTIYAETNNGKEVYTSPANFIVIKTF